MSGQGQRLQCLAVVALVAFSGCLAAPSTDVTATTNATATESPDRAGTETASEPPAALDGQLAGLVTADNRTAYAEANGLDYERNRTVATATTTGTDASVRVRAVVVLEANATLPEGYALDVVASADELVEVRVAADDLYPLAREDGVRFVRPPRTPAAAGAGGTVSP